jgi:hypothetical protein
LGALIHPFQVGRCSCCHPLRLLPTAFHLLPLTGEPLPLSGELSFVPTNPAFAIPTTASFPQGAAPSIRGRRSATPYSWWELTPVDVLAAAWSSTPFPRRAGLSMSNSVVLVSFLHQVSRRLACRLRSHPLLPSPGRANLHRGHAHFLLQSPMGLSRDGTSTADSHPCTRHPQL